MAEIPEGFCKCGCGRKTLVAKKDYPERNIVGGKPLNFINGHNGRGVLNWNWKGGRTQNCDGYVLILLPGHKRANKDSGQVFEHIVIAEKILGKSLPPKAVIHHVNENRKDNRPSNLVICQDRAYHLFLHQRIRAYKACGHAHWLKCQYCQKYDDPQNLYVRKSTGIHRECSNKYRRNRYPLTRERILMQQRAYHQRKRAMK